jgi:uncharacterized protein
MAISFYEVSVPVYQQFLRSLIGVLEKAEKHCADKSVQPAELFGTRLVEDMQPLSFQITMAIHHSAAAVATLLGQQRARPSGVDTFAGAKQALEQALADLESVKPADLEELAAKPVALTFPGRELKFTGLGFVQSYAMPQFFFHVTTAYDILRHKGVPVGKRDFLGRIQLLKS